jgi:hypothetical protein
MSRTVIERKSNKRVIWRNKNLEHCEQYLYKHTKWKLQLGKMFAADFK